MTRPTRLGSARRNVSIARYAIGIGAAAAFAVFVAAARVSHPGTHHASVTNGTSAAASTYDESTSDDSFFGDDGSSSIGPSGSASPGIQSGAS